jgi:hypothetical protein
MKSISQLSLDQKTGRISCELLTSRWNWLLPIQQFWIYSIQRHTFFGLWLSSHPQLKHNTPEDDCGSVLRCQGSGSALTLVDPLERTTLDHWAPSPVGNKAGFRNTVFQLHTRRWTVSKEVCFRIHHQTPTELICNMCRWNNRHEL